ncbi:MAG: extensin family protein [Sphingomonadaceae bacterium]
MTLERFARRLFFLLLLIALGLGLYEYAKRHPGDVPWTPLALNDPIGRFTPLKIGRLHGDLAQCRSLLDAVGQSHAPAPPVRAGECGYTDGVRLPNADGIAYDPTVVASCRIAAGLFMWEKQVVDPAAWRHFGQPVTQIETYGTYSCRRIGGGREGRYSEHASANAIDIAAFRLADGRRIGVASDWAGKDAEAAFLRDVRDGACRIFTTILSPDYNAAHRDHLHFDQAPRGGFAFCR